MTRIRPLLWISSLLLFSVLAAAEADNIAIFNKMLSNMDESVEPCRNFQNYSVKYIKRVKTPEIIPEYIDLFEELRFQTFEEGSLEDKLQRLYNACLTWRRVSPLSIREELTLEELEDHLGVSLTYFLNLYYGRFISPSSVVHINDWDFLARFQRLFRAFNTSVWKEENEIEKLFEVALSFPDIDRAHDCAGYVFYRLGLAVNLLYEERFLGQEKASQLQSKVQRIFEAIRAQINISLQRNPLNWTTGEITALLENINNLNLNVGGIPEKVNRRDFVTDYTEKT